MALLETLTKVPRGSRTGAADDAKVAAVQKRMNSGPRWAGTGNANKATASAEAPDVTTIAMSARNLKVTSARLYGCGTGPV